MKLVFWIFLLAFAGCAHRPVTPSASRAIASVDEGAVMSENEVYLCSEYDCANMVAPCTFSPEPSMMEERYRDEMGLLIKAGYCQLPPRELPAETYNKNTCLFVYVKSGNCSYHH